MAEIGDIIACRGDKYLVIANIKRLLLCFIK